eukprot:3114684-Amphidinium_carterae.2
MQHKLWLEELVQRLSYATHLMQHWKRRQEALQKEPPSKKPKEEMIHQSVRVSPGDRHVVIFRASASSMLESEGAAHCGGATVPEEWFHRNVIHSESEEPSEDSHQLRPAADVGSLDNAGIPTVGTMASLSLPSSLSSDMGYNPESLGTSRMVSASNSIMGDLDGQLGLTMGIDGVIRPHDLEVQPPPALVLPPQELTPCPAIISNLPWEFQDTLDDLQFSTSSSLVVVLPTSPRSDLGGVIGYAMDMEGVLRSFDYEMP